MPTTLLFLATIALAPDSGRSSAEGRVTVPAEAGNQPVLVVSRDPARGVTRSVAVRNGRFSLPGAVGPVAAFTLDGHWSDSGTSDLKLSRAATPVRRPPSAAWIAKLPAGETRRRFVLDCTGCHQFDDSRALKDGSPRPATVWREDLKRMLQYAGPRSNFPVISAWAEDSSVPSWLAVGVAGGPPPASAPTRVELVDAVVTEYDFPVATDLPHDVAVDSAGGSVIVTGMFSHAMFKLDVASSRFERIEIPLENANPRAVELDRDGNWWVLFGSPGKVGRYDIRRRDWTMYDIGIYPHSITVALTGQVWYNGHFSRDPELIGMIDPTTGKVTTHELPIHPTMGKVPGGPIPYEQREGPDGRIWVSELQGNRLVEFDPRTLRSKTHTLPTSWSGPRRFDVDRTGVLWIPAYSANLLVRLDPQSGKFTEYPLPVAGATPYIARVARDGSIWIGTSAADAAFRFDPRTSRFTMVPLPTQGALVRHMAIDPRNGDVWLAYGASPARVPARIARIQVRGAQ